MASKEEIKKRIEIMQAWVDGAEIEVIDLSDPDDYWEVFNSVSFNGWGKGLEYRIKQKPKEVWINEYTDGDIYVYKDEQSALDNRNDSELVTTIKYREVMEDADS